jgi:hypothetical protein
VTEEIVGATSLNIGTLRQMGLIPIRYSRSAILTLKADTGQAEFECFFEVESPYEISIRNCQSKTVFWRKLTLVLKTCGRASSYFFLCPISRVAVRTLYLSGDRWLCADVLNIDRHALAFDKTLRRLTDLLKALARDDVTSMKRGRLIAALGTPLRVLEKPQLRRLARDSPELPRMIAEAEGHRHRAGLVSVKVKVPRSKAPKAPRLFSFADGLAEGRLWAADDNGEVEFKQAVQAAQRRIFAGGPGPAARAADMVARPGPIAALEDHPVLELGILKSLGYLSQSAAPFWLSWEGRGFSSGLIIGQADVSALILRVRILRVNGWGETLNLDQSIRLLAPQNRHQRWRMVDPIKGGAHEVLYLRRDRFAGAVAQGLRYRAQIKRPVTNQSR